MKPVVGIFGAFQNGKSTLVNCLLDGKYARTGGEGVSVTTVNTVYSFDEVSRLYYSDDDGNRIGGSLTQYLESVPNDGVRRIEIRLWRPLLEHVDLLDTPGINACSRDDAVSQEALELTDIGIVVINNRGLSEPERNIIFSLQRKGIPFYVIMNCVDLHGNLQMWNPGWKYNVKLACELSDYLGDMGIHPLTIDGSSVFLANFIWSWYASGGYLSDRDAAQTAAKIDEYGARFLDPEQVDQSFFLEKSRILPIRSAISGESGWRIPLAGIRARKRLYSALLSLKERINPLKFD